MSFQYLILKENTLKKKCLSVIFILNITKHFSMDIINFLMAFCFHRFVKRRVSKILNFLKLKRKK